MSILKKKSYENQNSAQILLSNNLFSSSIHCSYYSCLQLMKHILFEEGLTETELKSRQDASRRNLHEFLINHFIEGLRQNNLYRQYRNSIVKLPDLKYLRVNADYKEQEMRESDAQFAIDLANRISSDLKFLNNIR
jgi:hypothetical protein